MGVQAMIGKLAARKGLLRRLVEVRVL